MIVEQSSECLLWLFRSLLLVVPYAEVLNHFGRSCEKYERNCFLQLLKSYFAKDGKNPVFVLSTTPWWILMTAFLSFWWRVVRNRNTTEIIRYQIGRIVVNSQHKIKTLVAFRSVAVPQFSQSECGSILWYNCSDLSQISELVTIKVNIMLINRICETSVGVLRLRETFNLHLELLCWVFCLLGFFYLPLRLHFSLS